MTDVMQLSEAIDEAIDYHDDVTPQDVIEVLTSNIVYMLNGTDDEGNELGEHEATQTAYKSLNNFVKGLLTPPDIETAVDTIRQAEQSREPNLIYSVFEMLMSEVDDATAVILCNIFSKAAAVEYVYDINLEVTQTD